MFTLRFASVLLASTLCVGAAANTGPKVNPEPPDLDSAMEAKIMRIKAKPGTKGEKGKAEDGCGNVNIGNSGQNEKKKPGAGLVGQDRTVVVVGDVVNMARCK